MLQNLIVLCCESLLILFAIYLLISWLTKTPFYPSSSKQLEELISKNQIKISGKNFVDIGSGDGRFVIWAAKHHYNASGIEFNPFLTLWSKFKIFIFGLRSKAKIYNENFKKHDFSNYDIVYLYIFTEHMDEIKDKLLNELKPNSVIIANTFTFTDLVPDDVFGKFTVYYIK